MPRQAVIDNPVINSPYEEPQHHFKFTDAGITDEVEATRRLSAYFVPVAPPKKKGKQLQFDTEWTKDRVEHNEFINRVRRRVTIWREGNYPGVTKREICATEGFASTPICVMMRKGPNSS